MYQMNKTVETILVGKNKYLANFESGSLLRLDETREKILAGYQYGKRFTNYDFEESADLLEELAEGGYFETISNPLATAYLHVTNKCNLNCIGCYSYDNTRNCSDKLTLDDIKYILRELKENGVETITISGGEPLSRKDIVDIIRYAKKNIEIPCLNVITNGTIYREEVLLELRKYVDALVVSIDGYSPEKAHFLRDEGTFPKVMKFVERARDMGLPVAILPTLHKHNIEAVGEYMKLSNQLKVPISFSLLTCSAELQDYIPTEKDLRHLVDFLMDFMKAGKVPLQDYSQLEARKNCGAGSNIISVTAEGDIYPCHMMHDTDTCMGNILETPLEKILKTANKVPVVEQVNVCNQCEMGNVCGGGCKARALLINGTWNMPDPYCELNKHFYVHFVKEMVNCE